MSTISRLHAAFITSSPLILLPRTSLAFTSSRVGIHRKRTRRAFIRQCATTPVSAAPTPLSQLRVALTKHNLYAYIIPTNDPHQSEYPPPCYTRRAYVSGFTGSAGTALVTLDGAYLWTDGRYFLQAEQQLTEEWTLMKVGQPETLNIADFLASIVPKDGRIGIDPFLHSVEKVEEMRDKVEAVGGNVVALEDNLVDGFWEEQPEKPHGSVRVHDEQFAGRSVGEKIELLRDEMKEKDCDYMLVSMLDEVCWTFNVRGNDIPHCPVVMSYGLVSMEGATFYVDGDKIGKDVEEYLNAAEVRVLPYEQVVEDVREIALQGKKIWLDPESTSLALSDAAGDAALHETTPIPLQKACKNEAELEGMREAHVRDGVALSSFLCWLEDHVLTGNEISEVEVANKLEEFRALQSGFLSTSFGTIAGFGPNGAIIHYTAEEDSCSNVNDRQVFLLDSGGQYKDGTTDVTRTMHFGGTATAHEKECYTRVLQGHIAIDTAVFPEDTTGLMLDSLSRVPLWSIGLDFRHGTGHGVGACLNVHEGPQGISPRIGSNKVGLKAGMIVSNEPGYYEDGSFGIRIENLLEARKMETKHRFGDKTFLGFKRLTYVPIDKGMIEPGLLSDKEIQWLDDYHKEVWATLSPRMKDGRHKEWLHEKTRPLLKGQALSETAAGNGSSGASWQRAPISTSER